MRLGREALSGLIPHAGAMCLVDGVEFWNEERIVCHARTHVSSDNPLWHEGRLSAVCGIEYAAQAMALHGALLTNRPIEAGFLASVRDLKLHVDRLNTEPSALSIVAQRLFGGSEGLVYEFRLLAEDRVLISGRATVVLGDGGGH